MTHRKNRIVRKPAISQTSFIRPVKKRRAWARLGVVYPPFKEKENGVSSACHSPPWPVRRDPDSRPRHPACRR